MADFYFCPPPAPVAVAKCPTYGPEVHAALAALFDQFGGLERLVEGKAVALKPNLTGGTREVFRGMPLGLTRWVHPEVAASTINLLGKAGARRIRIFESGMSPAESLKDHVRQAKWNTRDFSSAAPRTQVEFEDTHYPGRVGKYSRLSVPGGGLLFRAYDVNHSYADCDVYVPLSKLKEHTDAGVTLSMKNSFSVPSCTIYGMGGGIDEPAKIAKGARDMLRDAPSLTLENGVAILHNCRLHSYVDATQRECYKIGLP